MLRHSNFEEKSKVPLTQFHDTGIAAFFRILSNNLNNQNALADNKANIMVSINTVVLSLVIGSAARNVEYWQNLFLQIIMFVATLNKTLKSYAFAIVGAEYILRWLPIGTHEWEKFIKPDDINIIKSYIEKFQQIGSKPTFSFSSAGRWEKAI